MPQRNALPPSLGVRSASSLFFIRLLSELSYRNGKPYQRVNIHYSFVPKLRWRCQCLFKAFPLSLFALGEQREEICLIRFGGIVIWYRAQRRKMQRQGLSEALPLSPTSRFFYSSSLYTRFKYSARSRLFLWLLRYVNYALTWLRNSIVFS